jgi:hypothetical protein
LVNPVAQSGQSASRNQHPVPKSSKPQEFGDFLVSEMTRWKAVLGAKKP